MEPGRSPPPGDGLQGCVDRATTAMPQDHDEWRPQDSVGKLQAADHVVTGQAHRVPRHPHHEQVSQPLVEEDLDGHPAIRAGQDGGEGVLSGSHPQSPRGATAATAGLLLLDEPDVALHQGLQRCVRRALHRSPTLGDGWPRPRDDGRAHGGGQAHLQQLATTLVHDWRPSLMSGANATFHRRDSRPAPPVSATERRKTPASAFTPRSVWPLPSCSRIAFRIKHQDTPSTPWKRLPSPSPPSKSKAPSRRGFPCWCGRRDSNPHALRRRIQDFLPAQIPRDDPYIFFHRPDTFRNNFRFGPGPPSKEGWKSGRSGPSSRATRGGPAPGSSHGAPRPSAARCRRCDAGHGSAALRLRPSGRAPGISW